MVREEEDKNSTATNQQRISEKGYENEKTSRRETLYSRTQIDTYTTTTTTHTDTLF